MNNDATINFSVKVKFRLPEEGETQVKAESPSIFNAHLLPIYCSKIAEAINENLEESIEGVLTSAIVSWEAGELVARPSKPGMVVFEHSSGETFGDTGEL